MKKTLVFLGLITIFVLAACNNESKEPPMPVMVDVAIQLPDTIQVNEQVELKALVTQGDEKVNDADDVEFEIWKDGAPEDSHKKNQGELQGEGIYSVQKTFSEPGTYYVISHVTARDLHVMPKKQFIVTK